MMVDADMRAVGLQPAGKGSFQTGSGVWINAWRYWFTAENAESWEIKNH